MIEQYIEALIFASDASIRLEEIILCLQAALEQDIKDDDVERAIQNIQKKYRDQNSALELVKISGGYQFLTRKEMLPIINQLHIHKSKKKLSQSALETLAIIAYRQPITKLEIEQIRGVNCDYTVQKLLEKDLISIAGKAETPGRPILYDLSQYFLDYFGINNVSDLPHLKDIETQSEHEVGEKPE
ncbi:SMC-Scp complex subunit ScpB [Pedobacter sp. SD-b]|uniref:SMC-Scp complex subunit ScpB n=1 Tax=Pedobacter segetis TaxID=2793069 RepID=A0ABS1BHT9_9SPHI|nr:SMC-Scp complex subunit ScpB [Pedobacter segetis]MBK0382424.1 SMC-Scp complex subunit ScpB [Pedobacter segetis]